MTDKKKARRPRRVKLSEEDEASKKKRIKMAMLRRVHKKVGVAFLLIGVLLLILAAKVILINYNDGDKYSKVVLDHQQYTSNTIPFKRGEIIDCNGTILAYSEKVYNLILDVKLILQDEQYKEPTLNALLQCFELKREDIEKLITEKPKSQYEKLLKNLSSDQIESFQAILNDKELNPNVKGVWFEESYIRKYPFSTLACDVLGFASNENGGELGLESYYNDNLSGIDGISYGYIDENLDIEHTTKNPVDGNNLITTLDFGVQNIIEKHIKKFNEDYGSKNTAVVVMDPNNGEIVGMASYPVFDLNNPRDLSSLYTAEELAGKNDEDITKTMYSLWRNYCVSDIYEPGSTFKPFTLAAGFEEGFLNGTETFDCKGYEEVGGYKISCHVKTGHGHITLKESIMYSCNPAMMQIAAKMGAAKLAEYQARFGFGQKTLIDLPGEEVGILIDGDKMSAADIATNSFGQNFNVNMIQMISGFSSLINGGNYYQPHLIKRIETSSGEVVTSNKASLIKQTVTKSTSEELKDYMEATVEEGLAKKVKVTGYSIAGKTGTAQKQPRSDEKYVISFIGFAPADNPKFAIYVLIDEPEVEGLTSSSAPVLTLTHDILNDLLPYMNVYKDAEDEDTSTQDASSPSEKYDTPPLID